ncbi:hypothetical protein ACQCSX_11265 [Pseudarthrobacter sp. P1]|uniref:hypothetical protein n=1 Tax=Pseudarthrobacter sp. P1 TaxID=3418418 RepID=UPI003CEC0190
MDNGRTPKYIVKAAKASAGTVVAAAALAAVTAFSAPAAAPSSASPAASASRSAASATAARPASSAQRVSWSAPSDAASRIAGVQADLARAVALKQVTKDQAALFERRLVGRIQSGA